MQDTKAERRLEKEKALKSQEERIRGGNNTGHGDAHM